MSEAWNLKPIFDAVRAVCGPFDAAGVAELDAAIAAARGSGSDKPIFDYARAHDQTKGLSQAEVDLINRGIAAARADQRPAAMPFASPRPIGPKGLAIIKRNEGLELKAYKCPAGVWTIGYGSTGPHVRPGMVITEAAAESLLTDDLDRFEEAVEKAAPGAPQEQFDAMVSLAFNIGIGNFSKSSVLRDHRAGDWQGAASSFALWNKAKVKGVLQVLPGLVRRRAEEAALYRSGAGK